MSISTGALEGKAFKSVRIERSAHTGTVVLLGPGRGNALGPDFLDEFPDAINFLDADNEVRVIIIKGDGKHFSYGLDLMAMLSVLHKSTESSAPDPMEFLGLLSKMQLAMSIVETCRKPVIAAVSGRCIGAALELIAACAIRLCSDDALFCLPEVKLKIVSDLGGLHRLRELIGFGYTSRFAITGEEFDADMALGIGLVTGVYDTPQALIEATHQLASKIAENPPVAVQGVKKVLIDTRDLPVGHGMRYAALWNVACLDLRELEETMKAILGRGKPSQS